MCKLTIILVDPMKVLLLTFCNNLNCVILLKTKNIIFSRHSVSQRHCQISTSIIWIIWNFFAIHLTCPLLPSPTALIQCYTNTAAFFLKSILHLTPLHFLTIVFTQVNFFFVILVCCNSCLFYYWYSIFFFHRTLINYIFCLNIAN